MAVAQIKPATKSILTYEDYLELPHIEGGYEIIDGELKLMPGASWPHQRIVGNVYVLLRAFEKEERRGKVLMSPFDMQIQLFPFRSRQPDVMFITGARLEEAGGVPQEGPLGRGPELVGEVLSASETRRTVFEKLEDYRRVGVREAWLIGPSSETVEVLRISEESIETSAVYVNGQAFSSEAISGLTVVLADVFDE